MSLVIKEIIEKSFPEALKNLSFRLEPKQIEELKTAIAASASTYHSDHYVDVHWSDRDAINHAFELGIKLNEDEVHETLRIMEENFDADYGISWTSLGNAIRQIRPSAV